MLYPPLTLSSTTPSLEEIKKYQEVLEAQNQQPRFCKVSSAKFPNTEMDNALWKKAVNFAGSNRALALKTWFLLLQAHNTNPNGIAVIFDDTGYDCAESSSRRLGVKHYLIVALGEALTTKEAVFEELEKLLSQENSDVEKGYIFNRLSLHDTETSGVFKFTLYFGNCD